MINAYKNFFKGYVDFAGRSTRSDYWWIWLGNMIIYIPFFFAYGNAISNPRNESALISLGGTAIIYMVIGLALLLPGLALTVRRLRDAGFHWALIFIVFIPLGSIVLLVLLAMPTKEAEVVNINEPKKVQVEEVIEASPFEETDNK
jgi:membrane protein